jgi:hypothetical protein
LGTTNTIGGFLCVAEFASTFPTGTSSLVGVILNAPSVGRDADRVDAQDLRLEPTQVLHEDLPPCPKVISFVAVSLRLLCDHS